MVEPARETPGRIATACAKPISRATEMVIGRDLSWVNWVDNNIAPVPMSAMAQTQVTQRSVPVDP